MANAAVHYSVISFTMIENRGMKNIARYLANLHNPRYVALDYSNCLCVIADDRHSKTN